MRPRERQSLRDVTAACGLPSRRFLADPYDRASLAGLAHATTFAVPPETLRGRSVLVSSDRQLVFALALLQLDGIAARVVLCPPDLAAVHLPGVIAEAQVDTVVSDGSGPAARMPASLPLVPCGSAPRAPLLIASRRGERIETEWVLLTSGTTGQPKLVVHTLASLTGPLNDGPPPADDVIWSTFYDTRRYGGLQVLLRALLGGGSMVFSDAAEPVAAFLARAGQLGVTHMSGTPSHWRRALMSAAASSMAPGYIRLSGEVADQAILNHLATAFPEARIAHAFATTEAGVGFEVNDGLAGFPAALVGRPNAKARAAKTRGAKAEMRVVAGSLRLRSARTARGYLGPHGPLADADGFVDTGDMVELRDDRYYFVGRREGMINVGGQKVYPEEVEAIITRHPGVRMARVHGRPSPITGALVAADIVVRLAPDQTPWETVEREIFAACRASLPAHKVPAMLRMVPALDIAGSGKLVRKDA